MFTMYAPKSNEMGPQKANSLSMTLVFSDVTITEPVCKSPWIKAYLRCINECLKFKIAEINSESDLISLTLLSNYGDVHRL